MELEEGEKSSEELEAKENRTNYALNNVRRTG
jgi:hypothetical protein